MVLFQVVLTVMVTGQIAAQLRDFVDDKQPGSKRVAAALVACLWGVLLVDVWR